MSFIAAHTGECTVDGLHFKWEQECETWTLQLAGIMRLGKGRALFDSLVDFVDGHQGRLDVDLKHLRVDSAGLGSLVRAATMLGSRTRFFHPNAKLLSLMELCKLLTVLPLDSPKPLTCGEMTGSA